MGEEEHITNGEAHYKKQEYAAAIISFSKAIEAEPENAEIYYQRAMSFYHAGNLQESLQDMSLAIKHDPTNPFRYATRAYIRSKSDDTKGGIEDYKKVLELDPSDAIAENNLGMLEEQLGYEESAQARFKRAAVLAEQEQYGNLVNPQEEAMEPNQAMAQEDDSKSGILSIIGKVFIDSSARKDYWKFLKQGFKL